jgi:hypothetical protein
METDKVLNEELLTKDDILERYDPRKSYRAKEAIAFMDLPDLGGVSDVGRLMQIQTFKKNLLAKGETRREAKRLEVWRHHYIHSPTSSHNPKSKKAGDPFLFVPGFNGVSYIYKYRAVQDKPLKAKNHRERRLAKLNKSKKT